MSKVNVYVGIDNGVTGSVGFVSESGDGIVYATPAFKVLNYTKQKAWVSRIDTTQLAKILRFPFSASESCYISFAFLERPMINPTRFKQTVSAARSLEATLLTLEALKIPFGYIDSREWQRALLPAGLEGAELKVASYQVAKRLFPSVSFMAKESDGLLIAEYARRKHSSTILKAA